MNHIQRLQILAEVAIELLVRIPQELCGWFVVLLEALMEVNQNVVVLHKRFDLLDDFPDRQMEID